MQCQHPARWCSSQASSKGKKAKRKKVEKSEECCCGLCEESKEEKKLGDPDAGKEDEENPKKKKKSSNSMPLCCDDEGDVKEQEQRGQVTNKDLVAPQRGEVAYDAVKKRISRDVDIAQDIFAGNLQQARVVATSGAGMGADLYKEAGKTKKQILYGSTSTRAEEKYYAEQELAKKKREDARKERELQAKDAEMKKKGREKIEVREEPRQ
ncbi:unnamed protein product [Amoebophrya sp. A25]|nr:unnamed protein product [Amoebophrya sp. A25]|eukprot:GSA25T00013075001.1